MSATCGSCWKVFPSGGQARRQHLNATGHHIPDFECDSCFAYFSSGSAVFQHMDAKNHFAYKCQFCTETWPSDEACETHEREQHLYCRTHDRSFKNANNLRMHMNSNAHRPATLLCPLCKNSSYATATGLAHHLERGACPRAPNLNRDELFKIVRRCDPNSIISKNLLEWHGSPTYEATSRSWNARLQAYQCYLCNRLFKDLNALTQHINSPVHQESLYHCPGRGCGREFTTLAGIANHLESESCGYTRFEAVQRGMEEIISGNRLIGFR